MRLRASSAVNRGTSDLRCLRSLKSRFAKCVKSSDFRSSVKRVCQDAISDAGACRRRECNGIGSNVQVVMRFKGVVGQVVTREMDGRHEAVGCKHRETEWETPNRWFCQPSPVTSCNGQNAVHHHGGSGAVPGAYPSLHFPSLVCPTLLFPPPVQVRCSVFLPHVLPL